MPAVQGMFAPVWEVQGFRVPTCRISRRIEQSGVLQVDETKIRRQSSSGPSRRFGDGIQRLPRRTRIGHFRDSGRRLMPEHLKVADAGLGAFGPPIALMQGCDIQPPDKAERKSCL